MRGSGQRPACDAYSGVPSRRKIHRGPMADARQQISQMLALSGGHPKNFGPRPSLGFSPSCSQRRCAQPRIPHERVGYKAETGVSFRHRVGHVVFDPGPPGHASVGIVRPKAIRCPVWPPAQAVDRIDPRPNGIRPRRSRPRRSPLLCGQAECTQPVSAGIR
jgi:hypothetical protein